MSDPLFIRVVDLETTGGRPPGDAVVEIGWQDVVLGPHGRWTVDPDRRGARYVDPGKPIPAVTQAIHHILDEHVAGAPRFDEIGPEILRPEPRPIALAAHRAAFEKRFCVPALTAGARWICTWKSALRLWPDSPSFSNQVLRYWRRPEGFDHETGLPAHRAFPDAYVSAFHLRDMLAAASPEQLIEWETLPGLLPRVPHGPERGRPWRDLDDATLARFGSDRDVDIRYSALDEIGRRAQSPPELPPPDRQARLL